MRRAVRPALSPSSGSASRPHEPRHASEGWPPSGIRHKRGVAPWNSPRRYDKSLTISSRPVDPGSDRDPRYQPTQKRAARCRTALPGDFALAVSASALALRELEASASLGPAVLLALDDARVAGEEPGLLDRGTERRLEAGQSRADAVADRSGLAGQAAAGDGGDDVILALAVGDVEHLVDDQPKR